VVKTDTITTAAKATQQIQFNVTHSSHKSGNKCGKYR